MPLTQEFKSVYDKVFDQDGNIKSCGRETTIQLISICNQIDSNMDFGDLETGFMETENIQSLYKRLEVEKE